MRSTKKPTTPPTAQAEIYGECKDNSDSAKFEELKGSNKGGFCRFADQGVPSKSDFDGYTCDKECCRSKCEADADCTAFEFSSSSYDVCEVHFGAVAESSGSYTSTNKAYCGVRCPYFTSTTFTATTATSTSATSTTFTPTLLHLHDQCDPRADLCNVAKDLVCQPDTYKCLYASTASTESPGVAEGGARKGLSKAALTAIALLLVAVMLSVGGAVYYRRKYRTAQQHAAMVRCGSLCVGSSGAERGCDNILRRRCVRFLRVHSFRNRRDERERTPVLTGATFRRPNSLIQRTICH